MPIGLSSSSHVNFAWGCPRSTVRQAFVRQAFSAALDLSVRPESRTTFPGALHRWDSRIPNRPAVSAGKSPQYTTMLHVSRQQAQHLAYSSMRGFRDT
jgi:hypothetical protein